MPISSWKFCEITIITMRFFWKKDTHSPFWACDEKMDLNLPLQAQIRLCGSFLQKRFSASHPEYLPPFFISSSFVLFVVLLPSFSSPKKGNKREGESTEVFVFRQTRCILQRFLFAGRQDAYWFLFLFAECYMLFSLLKKFRLTKFVWFQVFFPFFGWPAEWRILFSTLSL